MTKNQVLAARAKEKQANSVKLTLGGLSVDVQVKGAVKKFTARPVRLKAWHVLDLDKAPEEVKARAADVRKWALDAGIPANKLNVEIVLRVMKGQLVYAKQLADAA